VFDFLFKVEGGFEGIVDLTEDFWRERAKALT
jgi:hypothetical protein